jgi:2'-5' RNA ligase
LKDAGLPNALLEQGAAPHVTLVFGEEPRVDALVKSLTGVLRGQPALEVMFASLATFANENGVLFLGPIVNRELLGLHEAVHASFADHASALHPYYTSGRWVPHCTLTMNPKYTTKHIKAGPGLGSMG